MAAAASRPARPGKSVEQLVWRAPGPAHGQSVAARRQAARMSELASESLKKRLRAALTERSNSRLV